MFDSELLPRHAAHAAGNEGRGGARSASQARGGVRAVGGWGVDVRGAGARQQWSRARVEWHKSAVGCGLLARAVLSPLASTLIRGG